MHQILLSRYFREELKQRIWGRGSVLGRPHRVLLCYIGIFHLQAKQCLADGKSLEIFVNRTIWKLGGRLFALEMYTDGLHQVIFVFLILGSSDLDPSMMLDTGEITDTGSDYEDQVLRI